MVFRLLLGSIYNDYNDKLIIMSQSFFFYDLETSGINPREQRIMQFAGQRTNLNLDPIGDPINRLICLTEDVLPDPDAILVTGITPQQTMQDGITEAEFLKIFHTQIATPNTIFVGYNNIRFDDEFIRYLHYRNFYDPYEWHWQNGRSRWDLLDVVRMTRALRPYSIKWPFTEDGKPTNRLELLTSLNGLVHQNAHDALSDVNATVELAKLIKHHQPKLFEYLLKIRNKQLVEELIKNGKPFVYTSGKYANEVEKTTVAVFLVDNPKSGALVYDLRFDPAEWFDKSPEQLAEAWKWIKESKDPRLPIKTLQYNRCPAVAPLTVLDDESKTRIKVDDQQIINHLEPLKTNFNFATNVLKALGILNKQQDKRNTSQKLVDEQLYDGFFNFNDKQQMQNVRNARKGEIAALSPKFSDERLDLLLPLYKTRNYLKVSSLEDQQTWEDYKSKKLFNGGESSKIVKYFKRIDEIATKSDVSKKQLLILEDLKLYGESLIPDPS